MYAVSKRRKKGNFLNVSLFVARERRELMLKRDRARVKEVARRLERAANKHNESADATCSVAGCFDSDGDLSDEMFDSVFETVTELARVSLDKKPDYDRAARKLRAEVHRRTKNA